MAKYDEPQIINGELTTYTDFKDSFEKIKVLEDSSHETRSIFKDKNGDFWIYDFHEEMNFSGGNDYMYEHFFKCKDLEEAEKNANLSVLDLKIIYSWYLYKPASSFAILTCEKK